MAANATVYASGLNGPRVLAFGPDGSLYVAEAGTGGTFATGKACTQVAAPVGPSQGARRRALAAFPMARPFSSGLPSAVDAMGDVSGVADVAFLDGELYALLAGGGCSHGNPTLPNEVVRVNLKNGNWRFVLKRHRGAQRVNASAIGGLINGAPDDPSD